MIICPVCTKQFRAITLSHIKLHNFNSLLKFKKFYNLEYLRCEEIRNNQSKLLIFNNPTRGRKRTTKEILCISKNRVGKGTGVAGKYKRTDEIRFKISNGVSKAYIEGRANSHPKGYSQYLYSDKANKYILVKSSWEARIVELLDKHPRVNYVRYEPIRIEYVFNGRKHNYIPDFLVKYDDCIESIWEIKPKYMFNDPKTKAKLNALDAYCKNHGLNSFIVDEHTISKFEKMFETTNEN